MLVVVGVLARCNVGGVVRVEVGEIAQAGLLSHRATCRVSGMFGYSSWSQMVAKVGSAYDARATIAVTQFDHQSELSITRVENLCRIACAA